MIFFAVDFSPDIPLPLRPLVETKIRQVLREPPKNILQVRVSRFNTTRLKAVVADFACLVTVLGVGGKSLPNEPEFILFRMVTKPAELQYYQLVRLV